ncbi:MAG: MBL fold metallo-hydrolase [Fibrobacter sp.]|nr:MBL fold metallo-hydrolase [Fibrobacter sp.]
MNFKIHRGTREIGGSCVEVWTSKARIVIDIGMPLVERDGSEFDFEKYARKDTNELVRTGVLPDIKGFYTKDTPQVDGILISHPHIDHYGFGKFVHPHIRYYMGEATHKLIELTCRFTPQTSNIKNWTYFEKSVPFLIEDMTITPFWMDHSAFDAYAFLIESNGKSLFYSGDFRGHGRKERVFKWFTHNAPKNVDYLLLEGTQIERHTQNDRKETDIEEELVSIFSEKGRLNLLYASGQNIDRLVSVYRACKRTGKTFVVDVYTACILKEISVFSSIPYPSNSFKEIRVFYPYFLSKRIASRGDEKLLYQFRRYKITKEEISKNKDSIVMLVRPSMQVDLERIQGIEGGNLVYSLWEGYLRNEKTNSFVDYLKARHFQVTKIHTSGHADIGTLGKMTDAISPKHIVPIHTFSGNDYQKYLNYPIIRAKDGETIRI